MRQMAGRADMHMQRRPGAHRAGRAGGIGLTTRQQRQFHIHMARGQEATRVRHPVAPRDRILVDAGEIERAALSGRAGFAGPVLRVDAAHPQPFASRHQPQVGAFVARSRQAGVRRAGHHRAVARQRENAVHGQPEQAVVAALAQRLGRLVQMTPQPFRAGVAGPRGAQLEHRRAVQEGARRQRGDAVARRRQLRRVGAVGLWSAPPRRAPRPAATGWPGARASAA